MDPRYVLSLLAAPLITLFALKASKAWWTGDTPHDLRHTHVAILIAENQTPRYIADRLGHKSTRPILNTGLRGMST